MEILMMHQTVARHDAIGNDIEAMYSILSQRYNCLVYAEYKLNDRVVYADEKQMEQVIGKRDSLILYHHSIFWEHGEHILKKAKGKIVFRYHNITPEVFFQPYSPFYAAQCKRGREQTKRLIAAYPDAYWLSASLYNTLDLQDVRQECSGICPPFHKVGQLMKTKPDEMLLKEMLEDQKIHLLFVGRVSPNKGHLFLAEILRVFILNYHNNIKLRIVGKFDSGLQAYKELLFQKIRQYRLGHYIEFIGEITDASLASYYLGSDLFLCASEHEGFCVPILEAQSFGLPVLALDCSAVPDTGGRGQVLLKKQAADFAAAIKVLMENEEYYRYMQTCGRDNVNRRFTYAQLKSVFHNEIKKQMK
ncbi:MAG: glycosyltransferase [Eubacterium sp.]|nr:glycosyltransferase [Eubacterium sp.]